MTTDNDDDWTIPDWLKIDPETRKKAWEKVKLTNAREAKPTQTDFSGKIKKHKLRKLRAEEKRLSTLIDEIGDRNPAARKRLYEAIKVVEQDIDKAKKS